MKRIISAALLLCFVALLGGCGEKQEKLPLPAPEALAQALLASGAFSEALAQADAQAGRYLYGLDAADAAGMYFYLSSGGTAEELAIFVCTEAEAQALEDAARTRAGHQADTYASYAPAEVPKLEKAVARRAQGLLLFAVAADYDKLNAVLDGYDWG